MPRETKSFKCPSGLEVIVYTYLTARESNEYRSVFMKAMKFDIADVKPEMKTMPMKGEADGTVLLEQEKILVKSLVKECPGGVDEIRESDYTALIKHLNEVKDGNLTPAK